MPTKLIRLHDGPIFETEAVIKPGVKQLKADKTGAIPVGTDLDQIREILIQIAAPLKEAWKELNKDMSIEKAEIEMGLSFTAEGSLFVAKASAGANLKVKLILQEKKQPRALNLSEAGD